MTINAIKQQIFVLKTTAQTTITAAPLKDRVKQAYTKWLVVQLEAILSIPCQDNDKTAAELITFLHNNWQLVKSTFLSPTSMPNSAQTLLLCNIAQWISNQKRDISAVELLFPGISVEAVDPNGPYPHLNMSSSNLLTIVKTHIISANGHYLIPIACILELNLSFNAAKIVMPYLDVLTHEHDAAYINSDEFKWLSMHSELSQSLVDAYLAYRLLTTDSNSLLGQLNLLCKRLAYNSNYHTGTEDDAGMGAYPALVCFYEYYSKLSEENKNNIPPLLKQEIDILISLTSERDAKTDAKKIMATCIATRRSELNKHMIGHSTLLSQITLEAIDNQAIIKAAEKNFTQAKLDLTNALSIPETLHGQDKQNLNLKLIEKLGISFQISSEADLAFFHNLSCEDIITMCQNIELRKQILQQFDSIETVIIFFIALSPDRLEAFINIAGTDLVQKFLHTYKDLRMLLLSLSIEKCAIICRSLQPHLPSLLKEGRELAAVLFELIPQQRTAILLAMEDVFPTMIKSIEDLKDTLRLAPLDTYSIILKNLNIVTLCSYSIKKESESYNRYNQDIRSGTIKQLKKLFQYFSPIQCYVIAQNLGMELNDYWDALSPVQQNEIAKNLISENFCADFVPNNIFTYLQTCEPNQCIIICAANKNKLFELNISELITLFKTIPLIKINVISNALGNNFLKSVDEAIEIICSLSIEQINTASTLLSKITRNIHTWPELNKLFQTISSDKLTIVCQKLNYEIPASKENIVQFIEHLPMEKIEIAKPMLRHLLKKFKNFFDFISLLKLLPTEKIHFICSMVNNDYFISSRVISQLSGKLTSEQQTATYPFFQKFFQNIEDYSFSFIINLFLLFPEEKRKKIIESTVLERTTNAKNERKIFREVKIHSTPFEIPPLLFVLVEKITTLLELKLLLNTVPSEYRMLILKYCQTQLSELIHSFDQYLSLCSELSVDECLLLTQNMHPKLALLTNSDHCLELLASSFTVEKKAVLAPILNLPALLHQLKKHTSNQQATAFATALLSKEPEHIKECIINFINTNHLKSASCSPCLFRATRPKTGLEILCHLDKYWLMQINDVLELGLSPDTKFTQEELSDALDKYCHPKENILNPM